MTLSLKENMQPEYMIEKLTQRRDYLARISKTEMFAIMAATAALRATCNRRKVGAVITDKHGTSVLSIGYNGPERGGPNQCRAEGEGLCKCVHAEQNALIKAPYNPDGRYVLYVTCDPCHACAQLIVNAGISQVVFVSKYRTSEGLDVLADRGIDFLGPLLLNPLPTETSNEDTAEKFFQKIRQLRIDAGSSPGFFSPDRLGIVHEPFDPDFDRRRDIERSREEDRQRASQSRNLGKTQREGDRPRGLNVRTDLGRPDNS
jgi:dCMP deaminase